MSIPPFFLLSFRRFYEIGEKDRPQTAGLDKLRYNNRSKRCGETDALLSELEECIPATDNTEKSVENNELKSVLNTFLAQLDERTRKIFVLRYFACYSIADISERLAITETNTTSILNRTRTKLRKYLSDKDVYIQKGEKS